MKINYLFFAFSCLLLCSCVSLKPNLSTADFLQAKMKKAQAVGLQATVIKRGELFYTESLGKIRSDAQRQVNDSTLFMVASVSKPVTTLTVLMAIDEFGLSLDDDINSYLPKKIVNPNFPDASLTFRHLLTHTSTIIDNWPILDSLYTLPKGGDSKWSLEQYIYANLHPDGLFYDGGVSFENAKPSEHWQYSNTGFALLGLLVETISKKPFNVYSREKIFQPLKMNDSYWFLAGIPHDNIAHPHEIKKEGHEVLPHYGYPTYPDGQLRTTATDYSQFVRFILNRGMWGGKRLLSQSLIEEFVRVQYPKTNKWQALAWNYNEFENFIFYLHFPRLPAHTGGDPGVTTAVMLDPETRGAVVLFLNTRLNNFKGVKAIYLDVLKRLSKEAGMLR